MHDDIFGWVGATIGDAFKVERVVGEGGFGVVYRGIHLGLRVPIAIKCLKMPAGFAEAEQQQFLEQFRSEAQLLHRLSSRTTAIIRALDFGVAAAPAGQRTPYLVMPWLHGETLSAELYRREQQGAAPRSVAEAVALLAPAAEALAVAHESEVAHLDIKPDNLFLVQYGEDCTLKVLDFGIAKLTHQATMLQLDDAATSSRTVTERGHTPHAFTPHYGAPEQFDSRYGETGPWTDVFALALVLVEVASGKAALQGHGRVALRAASINEQERPGLRARGVTCVEAVEAVVRRALAVRPEQRYPNARVMWDALERAMGNPSLLVTSVYQPDLSAKLSHALERQARLLREGSDTREVDAEILAHKRKLREGGQLQPGDVLRYEQQERFVLLERLGTGGFATVWKARDRHSGERVAVKVLHGQFVQDRTRRERFFRGAREMAGLDHEAVVRVLVPHAEDGGFHYFVMELVDDGDLHHAVMDGRIAAEAAVPLILQLGAGLAAAHAAGLVHRDVKPANVLLDSEGRPKLADFDLVGGANTTGGTRTGAMGTIVYAAPEMLHRPQEADVRADVYALGMTMLFVLHGDRLPLDVLRGADRLIAKLDCGAGLKQVVTRAVAWEPEGRYQGVAALCEALEAAAAPVSVARVSAKPGWAQAHGHDRYGRWALSAFEGVELRWRPIVPGTFTMGSPDAEQGRFEDEGPRHPATIAREFWLADTPCTQALWTAVMGTQPSHFTGDRRPVERVSYHDVQAFLRQLAERVPALRLRLPREAEWEYACRAGSTGPLYPLSGNERPPPREQLAWYAANASRTTHPVATKAANAWGLHDMLGNVWEWCLDAFAPYGSDAQPAPSAPEPPQVVRGGSWANVARNVRAACRYAYPPQVKLNQVGFRLALDVM